MKNRKCIIFPVMVLLALMAIGAVWLVKGSKADVQQSGTGCIVEIVTDCHRGQGVVFAIEESSGEIFILTAGHVMEGTEIGELAEISMLTDIPEKDVVTGSGAVEARLAYRSETADLAILSVGQEEAGKNLNCVKRDRAAFDAASEGDPVLARYLERGGGELRETVQQGTLTYPWVYLEDFGLNMMVAELPARSGMSGCGIFSAQGDFLGILCGVSAEGEAAILPLSVIESEWLLK